MLSLRRCLASTPVVGRICNSLSSALRSSRRRFAGSASYWEQRYREGGNSGVGSYGEFCRFKAKFLNQFVVRQGIRTIIEFGCGDGNQLSMASYPRYLGFDISRTAVELCRSRFRDDPTKSFALMSEYAGQRADLVLSLDVIFHLVEDDVFEQYMRRLFRAAARYIVIYSSNCDSVETAAGPHVRHRAFTEWVGREIADWGLSAQVPNAYPYRGDYRTGSFSDFFVYELSGTADVAAA